MAEFPAMPLWTDAYLADTGHLTTLEHGAYMLLLMTMWRAGGSLPNDAKKICRFVRLSEAQWSKMSDTIMEFFVVEGDEFSQCRLKKEMEFIREKRKRASESAKSKWLKINDQDDANAEERISETDAHARVSTPTPTPTVEKKPAVSKKGTRIPDDFEPDQDYAVEAGLRPERVLSEVAKFKDYWRATAGSKGVKLDWPATWRNWVRSALERQPARGSPGQAPPRSAYRQHQDDIRKNLMGDNDGKRNSGDDGQPFFDLGSENYRRD